MHLPAASCTVAGHVPPRHMHLAQGRQCQAHRPLCRFSPRHRRSLRLLAAVHQAGKQPKHAAARQAGSPGEVPTRLQCGCRQVQRRDAGGR